MTRLDDFAKITAMQRALQSADADLNSAPSRQAAYLAAGITDFAALDLDALLTEILRRALFPRPTIGDLHGLQREQSQDQERVA